MSSEPSPETDDADENERPAPAAPKRTVGVLALVAALAYVLDLVTKVAATAALEGEQPLRILGGAVYLQLIRNPYAAFGMNIGGTWLLAVVAMIVVGVIIWMARRLRSVGWAVGLGLVLAGALGNLTDRLFRAPGPFQGHVVDFVSVFGPNGEFFPIFNAADSAITIGAALIVVLSMLGRDYDGTRTRDRTRDRTDDTADPDGTDGTDGTDGADDAHDADGTDGRRTEGTGGGAT